MILELNAENIEKLGFSKEEINSLLNREKSHSINNIYFDYENKKIYTDIDMSRFFLITNDFKRFPFNYPDLIPEYYKIKLEIYLKEQQTLLGIIYKEKEQTKEFINDQINKTKKTINENQSYIDKHSNKTFKSKKKAITIHKGYLLYLDNNLRELITTFRVKTLARTEPRHLKLKEAKKELHNHIFKENAFEIWQSMFVKFKIIESNYSTDIDFMFEVMKYNNLIHKNIGLTDIKNWINKVYEISFEKIRHTNPKSTANEKRLIIYNDIISK